MCGRSGDERCKAVWRAHPAGGFRAFGYLPVRAGGKRQPDRQNPADSLRRSVPRLDKRTAGRCAAGGCVKASELDDGAQDHHRFLHHGQQGTGGHGSPLAVRGGDGPGAGGGTAGHVTPNIALLPSLKEAGYEVFYIGSYTGIEKTLIENLDIPYYGISSGKLRRYKSFKNLTDPFRVIKGYFQARRLMRRIKPDIIFSKGGFVSVPVVLAAGHKHIPVIIHESDMTPGLANRIAIKKATKVCCNFPETIKYLPADKAVLTGSPIRQELLQGNKLAGLKLCNFTSGKPIIMVVGGSTGAVHVNEAVRKVLPELLKDYQVVHLCGKGKTDNSLNNIEGYVQFEYISEEMRDLFAISDIVISRAGANAICELLALKKPNLLIPLSANASRGDQILNAKSFQEHGYSSVLFEEDLTPESLLKAVNELYTNRQTYINAMSESKESHAIPIIMNLINSTAR